MDPKRPLRRASALILRRRGEVYLARRQTDRSFFGNFFAFPGGGLDEVDDRLSAAGAVRSAFDSALIRETIEELGVALHLRPGAAAPSSHERADLLSRPRSWEELHRRFDLDSLAPPACRLITPDFYPLRFDTRFYLEDLGTDPSVGPVVPCRRELGEGHWGRPADWLARWRAGEILLVPPTLVLLQALAEAGLETADSLEDARRRLDEAGRRLEEDPLQPIRNEPLARLLPLRTPTLPPARHTNAYLVGRDRAYLVDPASPHPSVQEDLARVLDEEISSGLHLEAILLTHHHRDHVGAVSFVRRRFGVPVWSHAETARRLHGVIPVDRTVEDGQVLPLGCGPDGRPGWHLRALHTPGHAPGHLCFVDDRYRTLLAGDMVSTLSSILVDPEDGDLAQYEASLRRLIALQPRVILPAHGPADGRGATLLREQLDHRHLRARQVREAIEKGCDSVEEIVAAVYGDVPADQLAYAGRSVASILRRMDPSGDMEVDGSAPER